MPDDVGDGSDDPFTLQAPEPTDPHDEHSVVAQPHTASTMAIEADAGAIEADAGPAEAVPGDRGDRAFSWMSPGVSDAVWYRNVFEIVLVIMCCGVAFAAMQPKWVFTNTTATGGDMGAHVWGPHFLRHELLPHFQIAGWSKDWYAGFPAYQFYMVVPSMFVVLLDLSMPWWLLPVAAVGVVALIRTAWHRGWARWAKVACCITPLLVLLWSFDLPYNVAFKVVTVAGVVALPASAWALARSFRIPFPGPPLVAAGALVFLFDKNFSIYGGNILSTLAGEFAFVLSLNFALLYLAALVKVLRTRRGHASAAVLLAMTLLCHVIPFLYALAATVVLLVATPARRSAGGETLGGSAEGGSPERVPEEVSEPQGVINWVWATAFLAGSALLDLALHAALIAWPVALLGVGLIVFIAALANPRLGLIVRRSVLQAWSTALVVGAGVLVAGFWVLPFFLRKDYLNDMGWEKILEYHKNLFPSEMLYHQAVFVLAAVGLVGGLLLKRRMAAFLGLLAVVAGRGFIVMPQYRFWNARVLPLYYLCVYLLAAIGVWVLAEAGAALVHRARGWSLPGLRVATGSAGFAVALVAVLMPLHMLPGGTEGTVDPQPSGPTSSAPAKVAGYSWLGLVTTSSAPQPSWAEWNYRGLENKTAYREYRSFMDTMKRIGRQEGCGRALWEFNKATLDPYGTPMAPMLLPYWTNGCIGSMEGLYFEASVTTGFHFLMQTELSEAPSSAMRNMPYAGFDFSKGIDHLQLLGVRYYAASTQKAKTAAQAEPRLTQLATSGPWTIFEVADSELVSPLTNEPAVMTDVDPGTHEWLEPAVSWFDDPQQWAVPLAADGPASWQRVTCGKRKSEPKPGSPIGTQCAQKPQRRPVKQVKVSKIVEGQQSISFSVDRVGEPVLVKVSYFPNWKASGAEGPWRVAPNLMVVTPTSKNVTLRFGNTWVEWAARLATLLGLTLVGVYWYVDKHRRLPLVGSAVGTGLQHRVAAWAGRLPGLSGSAATARVESEKGAPEPEIPVESGTGATEPDPPDR